MLKLKGHFLAYLLILPSFVFLVALIFYPLGFSLYHSFQNWNLQISPVPLGFVGFGNYLNAFRDPTFLRSLANSLKLSIMATAIEFTLGLGVALLLNASLKGGNVIRAMLIMPTTVAPMVAGFLFRYLYYVDGLISYLLPWFGVSVPKQGILGHPSTALWAIAFTDIWEWTPFFAIILLAGLQSIRAEIIEAARIDGASFFRVLWHILLPNLTFVIFIIIMIRFMQTFNVFDIIYVLTMGGPGASTRTLSYNLYYEGLVNYNVGYASAIGWIMIIIIAIIINSFIIFAFKGKEL